LCQHEDFLIDRYDLLYQKEYTHLLQRTCDDIASVSPETEVVPHEIELKNPWDFEEVFELLHDFAKAYRFTADDEYLIHITTGSHVAQICLFLLTEARYFPGRLVQSGPGRGRAAVPSGTFSIIDLNLSRYDRIATRFQQERNDDISFLKSGIETRNPGFNHLIEKIERVAANSVEPILLAGPTGAGKSRLAKRIYELKKLRNRLSGSFVEVNCATLRGENGMAALFGHTKGAFTGATTARPGLLKTADEGLLFLDEIGELGGDEQAMLLRAIEEKSYLPVGADRPVTSNFQLICGSNRNLRTECKEGRFREGLLARINLWTFNLPGLRDRREDIEPNFDYELERFGTRTGCRATINKEARDLFLRFAVYPEAIWAANFRDLGGAVTRMATLAQESRITVKEVRDEISGLKEAWNVSRDCNEPGQVLSQLIGKENVEKLDLFDQKTLEAVIAICRSSTSLAEAGRILFRVSRQKKKTVNDSDRLLKYLGKYNLTWQDVSAQN
jgi:transcriptional regulatory protein RtcR